MKPNDVANRLLPYIGVYTLDPSANANDPNKRVLLTSDLEFLAGCMTSALGEMFQDAPAAISEQQYADQLYGPTNIVATLTQFSTAVVVTGGYAAWMANGCTCRFGGDDQDNAFVDATHLLSPYQGTTGSNISGTVWCDSLLLPQGTDSVLDSVEVPRRFPLIPVTTREEFRTWGVAHRYGNQPPDRLGGNWFIQQNKSQGQPAVWFAEARLTPALSYLPIFLRVNPMPMQAYSLKMRIKSEPPTITAANIGDANSAPDIPIPVSWQESVFLPYVAQRFSAHSSFLNKDARAEIGRQYQKAKEKLLMFSPSGAAAIGHFNL